MLNSSHDQPTAEGMDVPERSESELQGIADHIVKAHEYMANKHLMKQVQPHLDNKITAIRSIADLKRHAKLSASKPQEPNEGSKMEEAQDAKEV